MELSSCIQTLGNLAGIASDILVGLSSLAVACFAYIGINAWRRELKGRNEYEQARRVLRLCYKLELAIQSFRNPNIFISELKSALQRRKQELNIEETNTTYEDDVIWVYDHRLEKITTIAAELDAEKLESEVLWGREFGTLFAPLKKCVEDIRRVKSSYSFKIRHNSEFSEEFQKILESDESNDDAFALRVKEAILVIEDALRPHLEDRK